MARTHAYGLSDVGRSRNRNEDHFSIEDDGRLSIVADGMGGHGHGELASRLAVKAILSFLEAPPAGGARAAEQRSRLLETAFLAAHERLLEEVAGNSSLLGMGTTAVVLAVDGDAATVAHVGDSRAYRWRDGRLELLTEDHSWVNEQVRAGFLSEDQARSHPLKNVVTRALGGDAEIQVDLSEFDSRPDDVYLLCSDGLTTMLRDEEIAERLVEVADRPLEEACARLVKDANDRGGLDNITVVLVAIEE